MWSAWDEIERIFRFRYRVSRELRASVLGMHKEIRATESMVCGVCVCIFKLLCEKGVESIYETFGRHHWKSEDRS